MKKVVTRQFLLVTGIYIFIGLFGYFNYPQIKYNDMDLLPLYNPNKNIPALIGVVLLSVAIVVPMPLIFKPCRDCVALVIYPQNPEHNCIHYPLSFAFQAANIVICCILVTYNVSMTKTLGYVSGATSP